MNRRVIGAKLVGISVSVRPATAAEATAFGLQASSIQRASARALVRYSLKIGALKINGEWKTKIGRMSPYFFNSGLFCTGGAMAQLSASYCVTIESHFTEDGFPDVVFGPAYKGISLAAFVAHGLYGDRDGGYDPGWAYNRKEAKDHGEGGELVGASVDGKRVLIVDDVITAGQSKREAVDLIRKHGGHPIGCAIAFDRQERGEKSELSAAQEFANEFGIPLVAAATLDDLILELEEGSAIPDGAEALSKILAYKDRYGAS